MGANQFCASASVVLTRAVHSETTRSSKPNNGFTHVRTLFMLKLRLARSHGIVALISGLIFSASLSDVQAQTTISISNLWSISTTNGRTYVTSGNTERGVSYNPSNNHAYIVSRNGTLKVAIVHGDTGADL